jgi:hypothetical protein
MKRSHAITPTDSAPNPDWRRSPTRLVKVVCRDGVTRVCVEFDAMKIAELAEHYRLMGIDPDPVGRARR